MKHNFLFFLFSLSTLFAYSQQVNKNYDENEVFMTADLYFEQISNYSYCSKDIANARQQLFDLFGEYSAQYPHIFDLFYNENGKNLKQYLFKISDPPYENKIRVKFSNKKVRNCIFKNKTGELIVLVSAIKNMEFNRIKKSVAEVVGINTSTNPYSIYEVQFPSVLKVDCNLEDLNVNILAQYSDLKKTGDIAYEKRSFSFAKENYELAALYFPEDPFLKSRINACQNQMNYATLSYEADKYFEMGNLVEAKRIYEIIQFDFPENQEVILKKIESVNRKIIEENYNYFLALGNDNFENGFYDKAKIYFQKALKVKGMDNFAKKMIGKCDVADKTKIFDEINHARQLVKESNKTTFPEIIRVFTFYKASGILNGQDFYNMAAILDVAYSNVKSEMKYSNVQCYHLAKEYCIISMRMGYKSAEILWYDRFNNRARNE